MKFFMFVESNTVVSKGYGQSLPEGGVLISGAQYSQDINLATVNALPTYNEDGTVLTDADLTLLEDQ